MPLALACASHSPLMRDGLCRDDVRDGVVAAFAELAAAIRAFAPDFVIQFSPDHFNGFFYELMPAFCVGTRADAIGDWGTTPGPLVVPRDEAESLIRQLLRADFDVAQSHHMRVNHGFVQVWENLFGDARTLPIIPIFVNCAAPPLSTFRRTRLLGQAVGDFAMRSGKRVLIAASGGLSHDPPVPGLRHSPPEVVKRIVHAQRPTADERGAREERVKAMAREAHGGNSELLPVSAEWDRAFLDRLCDGPLEWFDALDVEELIVVAGRGGPEVLCWIAAVAAMSMAGPMAPRLHFYEAIQGWVAGMAVLSASTIPAR